MKMPIAVRLRRTTGRWAQGFVVAIALGMSVSSFGQVAQRAAFIVNAGNTEGSVTSYLIGPDGSVDFVQKLVTGQGPGFDYGTNAVCVSIAPNGAFLAIGHATGNPPPGKPPGRRVTIVRVHEDATMGIHMDFLTDPTPNSLRWIDNEHLVVTKSNFSQGSQVIVYHVDLAAMTATEIDRKPTGTFGASIALDPSHQYLYAEATSGPDRVRTFRINADRTLTLKGGVFTDLYVLGLAVSPDGRWVYGGGGITGDMIGGFEVSPRDGTLTPLENAPYPSPGDGPRQVVVSSDSDVLIAGHGGDATIHTFLIDQETGDLTYTGNTFDVGIQANLRDMDVLDDLLLVPARGILSSGPTGLGTFTIHRDGSLEMRSDFIDSKGISPNAVVGWAPKAPTCPADLTGDGVVDVSDLLVLLGAWGVCDDPTDCPADLNGDGVVDVSDLLLLLGDWGPCDR